MHARRVLSSSVKFLRTKNVSKLSQFNQKQQNVQQFKSIQTSSLAENIPNTQIVATVFGASGFIGRYIVSRLCMCDVLNFVFLFVFIILKKKKRIERD